MEGKPRENIDFDGFLNIGLDRARRGLAARFENDALKNEGITIPEWRALLNLAKYGDSHLREISRLATLDAANTSRAAMVLESKGLIRRYDDAGDARRKRLTVTKEGHRTVDRVWEKALGLDADIKDLLGKTRYRALKEALSMIVEAEKQRGSSGVAAE